MKICKPRETPKDLLHRNRYESLYRQARQLKTGQCLPLKFEDEKERKRVFSALRQANYRGLVGKISQRGPVLYIAAMEAK